VSSNTRDGNVSQSRCSWNGTIRVTSPPTACHISSMVSIDCVKLPNTNPVGTKAPSLSRPVKLS
jgi:hypothetical protein